MSKTIRNVHRLLATKGDSAPLGAGNGIGDLAVGQIGVFDADTNLSIAAGGAGAGTNFYLAVAHDNTHVKSAGTINRSRVRNAHFECYQAGVSPVFDFTNLCAECNTDYVIKFDITTSNAYVGYGMQPVYKTFVARPSECCETGTEADCIAIIKFLRDQMNNDTDGIFTAIATNPSNNAELNDAALDSWDVSADGCPNLRVTLSAPALADFCNIPNTYSFPTGVSVQPSMQGFNCCSPAGVISEVTAVTYPQGAGPDIKFEEYDAAGNDGRAFSHYRQTESGVSADISFNASSSETYVQLVIEYDEPQTNAFDTYDDPKSVKVAMPSGDSSTIVALATIIDAALGTSLATDAGNC